MSAQLKNIIIEIFDLFENYGNHKISQIKQKRTHI